MITKRAIDWKKLGAALLKPSDITGDINKSLAADIQKTTPAAPKPYTPAQMPAPILQSAIPSTPKPDIRIQTPAPVLQTAAPSAPKVPSTPEPDMQDQMMVSIPAEDTHGMSPWFKKIQDFDFDNYLENLNYVFNMLAAGVDPDEKPALREMIDDVQDRTIDLLRAIRQNRPPEDLYKLMERRLNDLGHRRRRLFGMKPRNDEPLDEILESIWNVIEHADQGRPSRNLRDLLAGATVFADKKYVDEYIKDMKDVQRMISSGVDRHNPELFKRLVKIRDRTRAFLRSIGPYMSPKEVANLEWLKAELNDINRKAYWERNIPPPNEYEDEPIDKMLKHIWEDAVRLTR